VEELLVAPPKLTSNGRLMIPTGPGLGIELNRDTVERYRVKQT
jgi:L-alanine-DL-glutamate epimerase-like enolase superfamily enzyme